LFPCSNPIFEIASFNLKALPLPIGPGDTENHFPSLVTFIDIWGDCTGMEISLMPHTPGCRSELVQKRAICLNAAFHAEKL
jgi:hypothetical protein